MKSKHRYILILLIRFIMNIANKTSAGETRSLEAVKDTYLTLERRDGNSIDQIVNQFGDSQTLFVGNNSDSFSVVILQFDVEPPDQINEMFLLFDPTNQDVIAHTIKIDIFAGDWSENNFNHPCELT